MSKFEIEYLKTDEIIPYENNPRLNDEAIEKVTASIEEFGFNNPILIDKNNVIIAGHTRLESAKRLGYETVPTIKLQELTEEQAKAFRLADNKVAEFAEWDLDKLEMELDELELDMQEFGFELDEIMMPDFQPVDADTQPVLDKLDPIYVVCPKCGSEFNAREQM